MRARFYSVLTAVSFSLVLVLTLGAFDVAKAVPSKRGPRADYVTAIDEAGVDLARNIPGARDKDVNPNGNKAVPDIYGIHNTLRP